MKKVTVGKSKGIADAEQCDIHVVSTRYSKNDVRKYIDGWWITSFNKTRKQRIKLIGSFKTKQLAENEREVLNVC